MEYLDKVLGVKVTYEDVEFKHLPNFIATRYRLRMVSMIEQKMIFLFQVDAKDARPVGRRGEDRGRKRKTAKVLRLCAHDLSLIHICFIHTL